MLTFTQRNLKLFFRDKSAVFFSLLAVFIIIGLYALFLGDVWTDSLSDLANARQLMDSWIMAGLLAVTSITTTMGAFGVMVDDRSKKIDKDFASSPIKKGRLAGGYLLSAYMIGVIMSFLAFLLVQLYILISGGEWLDFFSVLQSMGLILFTCFVNTSLVFFVVSFFKSQNAFATASTVIGTLIGFVTGIYLPVGTLPEAVQLVVKIFPVSHAAALFRQVLMKSQMEKAFEHAPAAYLGEFQETMGVTFRFGDYTVTPVVSVLILLFTAVLFYALATLNLSRKRR